MESSQSEQLTYSRDHSKTSDRLLLSFPLCVVCFFVLCFLASFLSVAYADDVTENFPSSSSNSALYYQMGGGRSVPIPAVQNSVSIPINAEGNIGLGFSCGVFNPMTAITNSLNNYGNSIQNVSQTILQNATSAITSFPMYKLAQADPKLYNILNNNLAGASQEFSLHMKSCEKMQSEALQGHDPYNDWMTVARNNNMKNQMSFGDGDLNNSISKVNTDQGDNGVPWASPGATLGKAAGGLDQPPIMVINDTAIAGYNVMLGRNPTDTSKPGQSSDNQNLLKYWATPKNAATWIVSVVGDQKVTTCTGESCAKDSTPGLGLLPSVQTVTMDISKKLSNLVTNPDQVNAKSLIEVSAPGQIVSQTILEDIRQMNLNAQSNTIATLSQNIATTRVVNEALLAINILQMGSEIPNIQSVGPAQRVISQKIQNIQDDINHIMYSVNIRRQLNSNIMGDIMKYTNGENAKAAAIPKVGKEPSLLENGGIINKGTPP